MARWPVWRVSAVEQAGSAWSVAQVPHQPKRGGPRARHARWDQLSHQLVEGCLGDLGQGDEKDNILAWSQVPSAGMCLTRSCKAADLPALGSPAGTTNPPTQGLRPLPSSYLLRRETSE